MNDAHYKGAVRKIARAHAEWIAEDAVLRHPKIGEPIEALARATVAEIDKLLLMSELTRTERDNLMRSRHHLAAVIQLTTVV